MERRHPRQPVDRPAKDYLSQDEGLVCRIRDISKGGAKVRIAWTGWLPDSFELEDSFTQTKRDVSVVWREACYVGVRSTDEAQWPAAQKLKGFGRR